MKEDYIDKKKNLLKLFFMVRKFEEWKLLRKEFLFMMMFLDFLKNLKDFDVIQKEERFLLDVAFRNRSNLYLLEINKI